jgi:hypothetical protein
MLVVLPTFGSRTDAMNAATAAREYGTARARANRTTSAVTHSSLSSAKRSVLSAKFSFVVSFVSLVSMTR